MLFTCREDLVHRSGDGRLAREFAVGPAITRREIERSDKDGIDARYGKDLVGLCDGEPMLALNANEDFTIGMRVIIVRCCS